MDEEKLIAEYARLRRLAHKLEVQSGAVDARLIEIERQLPDRYTFPGNPPLDRLPPALTCFRFSRQVGSGGQTLSAGRQT